MRTGAAAAIRNRGFTLVELVIVLAIAAVLAMLAIPSFQELIEGQRAKSVAADILIVLTRTRSEAVKRNANVTLAPKSGDWANGWEIPDPATGTLIEDHGAIRNLTVTGPASVVFQGSGRVAGGAAANFSISGSYAGSTRCVSLDLGGRPSVKASSC